MKSFSPVANKVLMFYAKDEARQFGCNQILPEHIILSILNKKLGIAYQVFENLKLDVNDLIQEIMKFLGDKTEPTLDDIPFSGKYNSLLEIAEIEANSLHNDYIGTEHLLLSMVRDSENVISAFFKKSNLTMMDVRFVVMDLQNQKKSSYNNKINMDLFDSKLLDSIFNDEKIFNTIEEKNSKEQRKQSSFLQKYCRDLTKNVHENKTYSVFCRDKEIQRIIQILSRKTKNNPVLTGEPGVGKTAVVEGLIQYIADGKAPSCLSKKRILSLDITALLAGTKFRGDFEERMKKMLDEIYADKNIILFIDEIHTIIGSGLNGSDGSMNAANILKPALSRSEIQIIGATTTQEYTKYIEKDAAFERRFQVVKIEEPSEEKSVEILQGIKSQYEQYHDVKYDDDVIKAIVKLSKRYIRDKALPDKAIDILDEVGASKKILEEKINYELNEIKENINKLVCEKDELVENQDFEKAKIIRDKVIEYKEKLKIHNEIIKNGIVERKKISIHDVENCISEISGIPVNQINAYSDVSAIYIENELKKSIIGQNEAIDILANAIRRSRAGITSEKQPIGSFLFLGPTGVGKTQLAKSLAKYLFGSEDYLIRLDMSDFMVKGSVNRLVGSPPGYVGYSEGGVLTEKIRRYPYSVVLFDEIEKSDVEVLNLLLQILEEGELADNLGHTVNFRNTIIILTSNIGSRQITNEGRAGFSVNEKNVIPYSEVKSNAMNELKKILSPELINRLDNIVVFNVLNKKEMAKILNLQLNELVNRLSDKKIMIDIKPKAKEYLISNGYDPVMGARSLRRLIRNEIENPLSLELLKNRDRNIDTVCVECFRGKIKVQLKNSSESKSNIKSFSYQNNSI
jgi:ATP-dependent Clp protease ATP-binding subunit ClpC